MRLDLYVDGGCIGQNPSAWGGTYGIVIVESGKIIEEKSGVIDVRLGCNGCVTNNVSELYALCYGILSLPASAHCGIYSDSENALGRVFQAWELKNVPDWLAAMRYNAAKHLRNLHSFEYALLAGHPNKRELAMGVTIERKSRLGRITQIGGIAVSQWNVYADELCHKAGAKWHEEQMK